MPVVVLVDTSLSMARMVRGKEEGEEQRTYAYTHSRKHG